VTPLSRIVEYRPTRLVVLATNLGLALASLGLWVVAYTQGLSWRADFTSFYTGWRLVVNGSGGRVYENALQAATQQQILGGRHLASGLLPFINPPHVALLFAPLGFLPLDKAYLVWSVLQLGLLVWLCLALWRHLQAEGVSRMTRLLVVSGVAALPSVGSTLLLGAFSTLMLLGSLQFALALRRDDDRVAGLGILLLTLKPQAAVVPGLMVFAARRWKAMGALLSGGVVILAVTSAWLGGDAWLAFSGALARTFGADASLGVSAPSMDNLKGLLVSLFGESLMPVVNAVSLAAFIVSLLIVLWLWSGERSRAMDFDLRMAITLLLGILFNLHVHSQDGVLLVVPALLFWHYLRRVARHSQLFGGIALVCPMLFWVTERFASTAAFGLRAPVAVMLALGAWMLRELILARRALGEDNGQA